MKVHAIIRNARSGLRHSGASALGCTLPIKPTRMRRVKLCTQSRRPLSWRREARARIEVRAGSASQKGATQGRILATAASRFALLGYHGVSTRDIAAEAGVNEVTIYRHYPRKRDLYLAVLDAELGKVSLHGDLLARIAEAGDGRAALARTFELILKALTSSPQFLRLLQYGALEVSEDLDSLLRKHLGEPVKVISRYLEPWIGRGQLRCANPEALVLTLIAIVLCHQPLNRVFPSRASGPESMFEAYAEICVV